MSVERNVADHYSLGDLARVILEALERAFGSTERLRPADPAPIDEFHIGWREATQHFVAKLGADRSVFAGKFFARLKQRSAEGRPLLGLHLLMGDNFSSKVANMVQNLTAGLCGPWELVCRKR